MSLPPRNPHTRINSLGSFIPFAHEDSHGSSSRHGSGSSQRSPPAGRRSSPSAASLTTQEHGRHFLANSPQYLFPWDSVEAHSMDLFHKAATLARGGGRARIHSAPLRPNEHLRILDLGTGTGLWVVEMADLYAGRSEVWGVDLAPFQPHLIPSNAKFQSLDIESHWLLGTASWDLIHIRCLNGVVRNWPSLYATVHSHLIPGVGYIEHVEIDWTPQPALPGGVGSSSIGGGGGGSSGSGNTPSSPCLAAWASILLNCMDRTGRPLRVDPAETRLALHEAGFVDVRQDTYQLPFDRRESAGASASRASPTSASPTRTRTSLPSLSSLSSPSSHSLSVFPLSDDDDEGAEDGNDNDGSHDSSSPSGRHGGGVEKWFPRAFDLWLEGLTLMPLLRAGYDLDTIYRLMADVRREVADPSCTASCTM
ncbi:hypothetical protein HMPREF1624_03055 [Sporothrix schenckii ATCC 58251]|uniref:Methyltransferase domain-containing protein n=1 Tax=Sporothrix schenckii (strain ATCC 58251 / de Perez 2211183) TaxID=1391915 RepID=U7PVS0_SPOS1|nr:hypothetical protein HMPREF1624_03055 [Sporothrix schenckii ATCC 58251]